MGRKSAARSLAFLAVLTLSGAATSGAAQHQAAATHTVVIAGMQFNPKELMVHRGDRVVWVNKDLFPHTVTAQARAFDSASIAAGASWRYVATKRGAFAYGCTFHPTMKGKITVQ